MAGQVILQVDGRTLRKQLRAAGDDMTDLKDAHKRAADIAANRIRGSVPTRSGALLSTLRTTGTKSAGIVRLGKKRVPYAGVLEYGWPKGKTDSRGRDHKIKAQAFARTGAKESESAWTAVYHDAVQTILNRITGDTL
ncbi:MAG: hypothetical protein ACTH93_09120 [Pseudoclavibacter sp.]